MKKPILSLPIDTQLDKAIRADVRQTKLSRADVVRQVLLQHYGLLGKKRIAAMGKSLLIKASQ